MIFTRIFFRIGKESVFWGIVFLACFCLSTTVNSQEKFFFESTDSGSHKIKSQTKSISPVKVAIIDSNFSGVDMSGFQGEIASYDIISGSSDSATKDIITQQGDVLEENNNHGTKVLREFIEEYDYLRGSHSPNVLLVKISSGSENQGKVSSQKIAEGIRYAVQNGAKVINISLGTLRKTKNVLDGISYAHSQGVIVVAASGNWGEDEDVEGELMSAYAQSKDAIAVGALDDEGRIASYTSGIGNDKLEFFSKIRFGRGTSLATPVVSANVARILEESASLQNGGNSVVDMNEIKKALIDKSREINSSIRNI